MVAIDLVEACRSMALRTFRRKSFSPQRHRDTETQRRQEGKQEPWRFSQCFYASVVENFFAPRRSFPQRRSLESTNSIDCQEPRRVRCVNSTNLVNNGAWDGHVCFP